MPRRRRRAGKALRRELGSQLLGDGRNIATIRIVLHNLAHQSAQLLERIGLGRCGGTRDASRSPAIDLDLVDPALAEGGSLVLRLCPQQVKVQAQAPGQCCRPGQMQPCHEMLRSHAVADLPKGSPERAHHVPPILDPAQFNRHTLELGDAGEPLLQQDGAIVHHGGKRH
jgi:hypothetical protein